jgi:hypothetical protein
MALRGPGTRRTASGDPEESIKVAVMDTRSGRSGGHKLKGPLECKRHSASGGHWSECGKGEGDMGRSGQIGGGGKRVVLM